MRSRVSYAVRHSIRRDEHLAGLHVEFTSFKKEYTSSFNHVVQLVHAGVSVKFVGLARLESIQTDQYAFRFEDGALAHLVVTPYRVIRRPDDDWMFHNV